MGRFCGVRAGLCKRSQPWPLPPGAEAGMTLSCLQDLTLAEPGICASSSQRLLVQAGGIGVLQAVW